MILSSVIKNLLPTTMMMMMIVQMTFVVDSITWIVLVPMLLKMPDQEKVEKWKALFFCFSSYMVL